MSTDLKSTLRAGPVRGNLGEGEQRLVRRRGLNTDKFHVPEHLKKPELSYEWHREMVAGQPDVEHQVQLAENHWRAVPASDMPGMMPDGYDGAVRRGGQVLMARPAYLTEDANQETLDIALGQVHNNERRLGQAPMDTLPRAAPRVSRDYLPPDAADMQARKRLVIPA